VRRIPIRVKLAAALAVPLSAMGLVTIIEVRAVVNEARDVRAQTDLATATIGPGGLMTALQNERNWASAHIVGVEQQIRIEVMGYDETRSDTDAALAEFHEELDRRGEAAQTAYAPALAALDDELRGLRTEIDGYASAPVRSLENIGVTTVLFDRYTELIEPFFGGMARISIAIDDPELRQGARLMEVVARQGEVIPQLTNALVLPATVATGAGDVPGVNRPTEIARVAELEDAFLRNADTLRSATRPYADIVDEYFPDEFNRTIEAQANQALTTGRVDVDALLAGLAAPSVDQAYVGYRAQLAETIQARADELNNAATSWQHRYGLLLLVTFAGGLMLTVVVSLSITRPLRSLTRQAQEMAGRLPVAVSAILDTPLGEDVQVPTVAPVEVVTRDEVVDVAGALNKVQDTALDLAFEQAVLRRNIADSFVNLGRRNQNLLGRQLDFITELEASEVDPDALASLFRLDHLATRMRRNAESLLVLAGIEPPRQWAAPVRIADVIRAALGEVEDYQRAAVRGVEPATVIGSAAADLAHLLAELIENALVFSPPARSVEVRGVAHSRRHPGGYVLAVIDAGLGMSEQGIRSANLRLAGGESFTIAPSKYLGHYVAGNLAARHGIEVELHASPGNGITATLELPASILTGTGTHPGGRPDRAPATPTNAQLASIAPPRIAEIGAPGHNLHPHAAALPPPLARRARGAQMPATAPISLRRTPVPDAPPPRGGDPRGATVQPGPPQRSVPADPPRAATEIYRFLTSFTAGVQRGLEKTEFDRTAGPGAAPRPPRDE